MRLLKTSAEALLLLFKPAERVSETGDGAERRDSDGKIDLLGRACALKQGLVVKPLLANPFALEDEIEATDTRQMNLALALELHKLQDFFHDGAARLPSLRIGLAERRHREGIAKGRNKALDVHCRHDETQVNRCMATVGDHR